MTDASMGERRRRREEERLRALAAQGGSAPERLATPPPGEPSRPLSRRELRERAEAEAARRAAAQEPAGASPAPARAAPEPPAMPSRRALREAATPSAAAAPRVTPPPATGGIRRVDAAGHLTPVEPPRAEQVARPEQVERPEQGGQAGGSAAAGAPARTSDEPATSSRALYERARRNAGGAPASPGAGAQPATATSLTPQARAEALRSQAARARSEREEAARLQAERAQAQRAQGRPAAGGRAADPRRSADRDPGAAARPDLGAHGAPAGARDGERGPGAGGVPEAARLPDAAPAVDRVRPEAEPARSRLSSWPTSEWPAQPQRPTVRIVTEPATRQGPAAVSSVVPAGQVPPVGSPVAVVRAPQAAPPPPPTPAAPHGWTPRAAAPSAAPPARPAGQSQAWTAAVATAPPGAAPAQPRPAPPVQPVPVPAEAPVPREPDPTVDTTPSWRPVEHGVAVPSPQAAAPVEHLPSDEPGRDVEDDAADAGEPRPEVGHQLYTWKHLAVLLLVAFVLGMLIVMVVLQDSAGAEPLADAAARSASVLISPPVGGPDQTGIL